LRYPKNRSTNRATQPKRLVNVVSKTSSAHSLTLPWPPLDPLGSQGHHQYRHLPLSLRRNLSAFSVVPVSGETPNQPDRWVASLQRPHQPTRIVVGPLHFTTVSSTAMTGYSRGFGLKLSFSSENLPHPLLNTRLRDWL